MASIGVCLGRGTILSMILVMGVLPQLLLLGDSIVEKTSFNIGRPTQLQSLQGAMRINGHVRGYINGFVDADVRGFVNGTVSASIDIGKVEMEQDPNADQINQPDYESIPEDAGEENRNET